MEHSSDLDHKQIGWRYMRDICWYRLLVISHLATSLGEACKVAAIMLCSSDWFLLLLLTPNNQLLIITGRRCQETARKKGKWKMVLVNVNMTMISAINIAIHPIAILMAGYGYSFYVQGRLCSKTTCPSTIGTTFINLPRRFGTETFQYQIDRQAGRLTDR